MTALRTGRLRLLADENMRREFVLALRAAGHDVSWQSEDGPTAPDTDVLARAVAEERTVVTFDKDFGDLVFRSRLPATVGVILLRVPELPDLASWVVSVVERWPIETPGNWSGLFASVGQQDGVPIVRIRRLPAAVNRVG